MKNNCDKCVVDKESGLRALCFKHFQEYLGTRNSEKSLKLDQMPPQNNPTNMSDEVIHRKLDTIIELLERLLISDYLKSFE